MGKIASERAISFVENEVRTAALPFLMGEFSRDHFRDIVEGRRAVDAVDLVLSSYSVYAYSTNVFVCFVKSVLGVRVCE